MALGLIALAVISIALTAFSVYAASQAIPPDEVTGNARKLSTSSDAESPWELAYGDQVKGGHVAWAGVAGGDQERTGVDYILASHPCEAVVAVQVGNSYLPVTTDPDATEGLILNANRAPPDTEFPDAWLVPVKASAWFRKDQTKNTSDKISHIGIKLDLGTQTTTDTHMTSVFGTKYTAAGARKFIGHSAAHVIFRAHDELDTLSGIPTVKWRFKGKNDIALNDSGSSTGYTASTAAVLADLMKMFGGVLPSEIVNHAGGGLASLITECASTAWDPQGTAPRYEFHGTIRYDEEPTEAYAKVAKHMMGGFSERGDKVVFWTGTARSAAMALTVDDFAGDGSARTEPVADDDWVNTYVPHRVIRLADDEDGNPALYGEMEPARKATTAAYVTQDGGAVLVQDIMFEGCDLARRARDWAHIALDTVRLGDRYTRKYRKRAIRLEVGDIFSTTDPTRLSGATKFRVIHKSAPDDDWNVELTGVRYEDAIYDQRAVTEDAIGKLARNRSTRIPLVAGLDVDSIVDGSANVQPNGKIRVDVLVTWNAVTKVHLRAGDVQVSWKKSSNNWPGNATMAAADEVGVICKSLLHGVSYDFRARIVAAAGTAGRPGRPRGDWAYLNNQTIATDFLEPGGPPGTGAQGANQIVDGNFEHGPTAGIWDLVDETATATGSATIQTIGGKQGPHRGRITITSAAIGNNYKIANDVFLPVIGGEWKIIRALIAKISGSPNFEGRVNVLLFNSSKTFVVAHGVVQETADQTPWPERRYVGRFQVPVNADIAWLKIQLEHRALSAGAQESVWDSLLMKDMDFMRSATATTQVDRQNDTWVNLVSLVDFEGGDEGAIHFDGETEVTIAGVVYASVKRGTSNVTTLTRALARLRLEEIGVGTTSIVTQVMVARMSVADGTELGSNGVTDVDMRKLEAVVTPPLGTYKVHLEGRHLGDATNGTAQFTERWIRITKN